MEAHNKRPAAVLEKILAVLPLTTYPAGETILKAGTKTGRLLILNKESEMKVLESVKKICRNCKIIRRNRVVRVICTDARHKQRQG